MLRNFANCGNGGIAAGGRLHPTLGSQLLIDGIA